MNGYVSVVDQFGAAASVTSRELHVRSRPMCAPTVEFNQVTVGDASPVEIAAAADRYGFQLRNMDDAETLYVGIGAADPGTATGFAVPPGALWSPPCGVSTSERIMGISSSGDIVVAFIDYLA